MDGVEREGDGGMGREIMEPRKEMLDIHLEERRGSRVGAAEAQYLCISKQTRQLALNIEREA